MTYSIIDFQSKNVEVICESVLINQAESSSVNHEVNITAAIHLKNLNIILNVGTNLFSMFLNPEKEDEIGNINLSLRNSKYDLNSVSVGILKRFHNILNVPISFFINNFFNSGVFPDCLKDAFILLIHKKGSRHEVAYYRPISILPLYSKVMEKCMGNRLISFLDKYAILKRESIWFSERNVY